MWFGVVHVLVGHEPDELGVLVVVVEGQFGQCPQGLRRGQMLQIELLFDVANFAVSLLQHGHIQLLLAAEVVIEHPLRRASECRYVVDSCPGVADPSELRGRHLQDLGAGALGVALPLG